MKILFVLFSIVSTFAIAQHEQAKAPGDTAKKSVPREVHTQIGEAHMMIHYHSPAVRGRVIWGGLVSYGEIWVTGAHSATTWEFNKDIVIGGKLISQGKYAIFTIPDKNKWTFILNKNWNQHLADDYDTKEDIVRLEVTPVSLATVQERLKYAISPKSDVEGRLTISWEKVKIEIQFQIK